MLSDRPVLPKALLTRHCFPLATRSSWMLRGSALVGMGFISAVTMHLGMPTAALGESVAAVDVPAPSPAQVAQTAPNRPILQLGSEGQTVAELQAMLRLMGYYTGPVDGMYEIGTASAVAAFQQSAGLQADGIVGPVTWNRLLPPSAAPATPAPQPAPSEPVAQQPAPTSPQAPSNFPSPTPTNPPATTTPTPTTPTPTNPPAATTPAPTPAPQPQVAPEPEPTSVDLPILRRGMEGPAVERLQERMQALGFYYGEVDGIFGLATEDAVRALQRNFAIDPDGVVGPVTWTVLLR